MANIRVQLYIIFLQLPILINSQVPTTGCDAITSGGTCFSYFTSTGVNWADSRLQCVSRGYDIATITSLEDNTLLYSIATSGIFCWIGLHDINAEGAFVWADGSNSLYRNWNVGQPDNFQNNQDCALMWGQGYWDDDYCMLAKECYFCASNVNAFGEVTGSTYSSLEDNTVLISDTTLYCVTENENTPQVMWSYVDLAGTRTDLTSTTNASTGVSTIQVYTTQPGYFSCEVTENGGSNIMYTAVMTDTNPETVPSTGCDAISSGGTCFSYFTSTGINWADSRLQCVSRGYDIATITSSEDNTLLYSIATSGIYCWIGLNDMNAEDAFVWADGSSSLYRNWGVSQPDNFQNNQDCALMWGQGYWDDDYCMLAKECYFCASNVNAFGKITGSTFSSLPDNRLITSNTTLYCVTENENIPQVMWSYVDLVGTRTDLTSTTDASTGVSTIQVYITQPGYYSCEVTENGGYSKMYTAGILSSNIYPAAVNNHNYSHTIGIDREDIYLWYESNDKSVQLTDIKWRRQDITETFINPLLLYDIIYLQSTSYVTMECIDVASGYSFITVGLFFQGPPIITLSHGPMNSFSLLPPDINRADVEVLTQNVVLSSNLVGGWLTSSNSYVTTDTINFPLFHQTDAGLYEFYTTNWDGLQELAIQIYLSITDSSFGEQINSTTYISLTEDSILITNTTLYCVAEDKTSPQVVWSYLPPSGTRTNLMATTNDVTTGISTLYVYSINPGYYSCEVTTEEGTVVTHTVRMFDTTFYTEPKNGDNYTYTNGIDSEDTFLFCNTEDSSVQLSNIYWRRQNRIGSYSNPLDVYTLRNTLIHTNNHEMQCFNIESGINIRSIGLYIQGPPEITLNHGSSDRFILLPPDTNRAEVEVLSQNVVLSTNLVGRWYRPDDSFVTQNSLTFTIFHQSDEGLYRFYVTDWNGDVTLSIQVNISIADSSFGEQINSTTYISLTEDFILITNTTLYCVAEDKTSPQVVWSYLPPSGTRTNLTATTNDVTTGISTLYVYSNNPGYYSCEVTTEEGTVVTHTVRMLDTTLYTKPLNGDNYTYTTGIDSEDTFLFCNTEDSSVQLSDIYWRRKDGLGYYSNPLDVYTLRNILILSNDEEMECFDTESGDNIMSIGLYIQGLPVFSLNNGSFNTFSLLPPDINRADVKLLTQDVALSTNLVGRWQTPDTATETHNSLIFPIFGQSDEGMYRFYVTDWSGEESLAIQIVISIIESTQRFIYLSAETLNQTSVLVSWGFLETNQIFQDMTFFVYLGFGTFEDLAGVTTDFYYEVSDLVLNVNYTIRVESVIPYSTQMISSTTYHFLEYNEVTGPTVLINNMSQSTQTSVTTVINEVLQISNFISNYSTLILIGGILIIISLLVLVVIIVVITCFMKKRRAVKYTTIPIQNTNPILFELPAHANENYEQVANENYEQVANANPAYMTEKGEEKIDLGMDRISLSNISSSSHYDV